MTESVNTPVRATLTRARVTCIMGGLQVSHAPRQLWPRDASAAPRQLQPLGVDNLRDEQAIERLECLSSVRARLLRHQRRYDRIMGRMLTRLQVTFASCTSQVCCAVVVVAHMFEAND